jgi:hypothetical protein
MNGVGTRDKVLYGGFAVVLVIVAGLVAMAIWRNSATDQVAAAPPSVAAHHAVE